MSSSFEIQAEKIGGLYHFTGRCSLGGDASCTVSESDISVQVQLGVRLRKREISSSDAEVAGRSLFALVFQGSMNDLYHRCIAAADAKNSSVRISVRSDNAAVLQEVPWELLHDGRNFVALNSNTQIHRHLLQLSARSNTSHKAPEVVRLLLTSSCPNDFPSLDYRGEEHALRQAIKQNDRTIEITVKHHASYTDIAHRLLRAEGQGRPFHIWHHSGHGGEESPGTPYAIYRLILEDEAGQGKAIESSQLTAMLDSCRGLRVSVLNACDGDSVSGLAVELARFNIPAVVGFRGRLGDEVAIAFTRSFYSDLLNIGVERSVGQARLQLNADFGMESLAWCLPMLFLRPDSDVDSLCAPPTQAASTTDDSTVNVSILGDVRNSKIFNIGEVNVGPSTDDSSRTPTGHVGLNLGAVEDTEVVSIGRITIRRDDALKSLRDLEHFLKGIGNA